jgi:hypothetical protein
MKKEDKPEKTIKKTKAVIPLAANPLSKDEIIEIYKEELKRKDDIISNLEKENKLLLELTIKNTKKRLEEISDMNKKD